MPRIRIPQMTCRTPVGRRVSLSLVVGFAAGTALLLWSPGAAAGVAVDGVTVGTLLDPSAVGVAATLLPRPASGAPAEVLVAASPGNLDDALEELLEADRAFARHSEERGMVAAFAEYLAADALMLPNGGLAIAGRKEILEVLSSGPPTRLVWEPRGGTVADSGELGTTWGVYRAMVTGGDGAESVRHGKYVTVWRKGPDGAWKVTLDMGNSSPAPTSEAGTGDRPGGASR